jgi:hypothetical protein
MILEQSFLVILLTSREFTYVMALMKATTNHKACVTSSEGKWMFSQGNLIFPDSSIWAKQNQVHVLVPLVGNSLLPTQKSMFTDIKNKLPFNPNSFWKIITKYENSTVLLCV